MFSNRNYYQECVDGFQRGFWHHTVMDSLALAQDLVKREGLQPQQLLGHNNQNDVNYTDYTQCTFLKAEIPITVFSLSTTRSDFGLFFKRLDRKIDWWSDCNYSRDVSDEMKRIPQKKLTCGRPENEVVEGTESDIRKHIQRLYEKFNEDEYYQENPDLKPQLKWNEGFIRPQIKDIVGIRINSTPSSAYHALQFAQMLKLSKNIPYFEYNAKSAQLTRISKEDVLSLVEQSQEYQQQEEERKEKEKNSKSTKTLSNQHATHFRHSANENPKTSSNKSGKSNESKPSCIIL
jgi:hypothetical protein